MNRVQIIQNFYLDEFIVSQAAARRGITRSIKPGSEVFRNVEHLCTEILQPIHDYLGPIVISSGYRPPEVNRLIGGSKNSAHPQGLAADFSVLGSTPYKVANWISRRRGNVGRKDLPLFFDQCIHEFGQWVHVGLAPLDDTPHLRCLMAYKRPATLLLTRPKSVYAQGIHHIADLTQGQTDDQYR